MNRPSLRWFTLAMTVATWLAGHTANAQVLIDMPPPPAHKASADSASLPDAAIIVGDDETVVPAATAPYYEEVEEPEPTVGEVAISRYARARTGTYDTYFSDNGRWNNRWNNSSWWWGGGWGWGWGGWGWPVCNTGCSKPCARPCNKT